MYFNPHGLRNLPRGTKAAKVIYSFRDAVPVRPMGKICGAQDWIIDDYLEAKQLNRKGRYKPRQIARNFFK